MGAGCWKKFKGGLCPSRGPRSPRDNCAKMKLVERGGDFGGAFGGLKMLACGKTSRAIVSGPGQGAKIDAVCAMDASYLSDPSCGKRVRLVEDIGRLQCRS